ncbi:hypothetical protein B0H34DRAFT_673081 [Crassisporium funariophilum]|nr:hypothetical protein B0H34DRAFT_673081 [Crassisporium funariophilum]
MTVFATGSMYTPESHCLKIALWIAHCKHPFAIVEDQSWRSSEIFVVSRQKVGEILQAYPGKIHICADGWTLPQVIAFIGTTAHWIIDGMTLIILDFTKVTWAHSGKYLATQIAKSLCDFGIQDKVKYSIDFDSRLYFNNDMLSDPRIVADHALNQEVSDPPIAAIGPTGGWSEVKSSVFCLELYTSRETKLPFHTHQISIVPIEDSTVKGKRLRTWLDTS